MLTKNQLKFRIRSGKVKPVFVTEKNAEGLVLADRLVEIFGDFSDTTRAEAEEELSDVSGNQPLKEAFSKILFSRCDEVEDDGTIALDREKYLKEAERIRREGRLPDLPDFQAEMAEIFKTDIDEIRERLYGDLPQCRKISGFRKITSKQLIERYNLAQVQGLLLRSSEVSLTLKASLAEKRKLFRFIKFHRLIACVEKEDRSQLTLSLGGPLTVFQSGQSYGMRLANFFPHVIHLSGWKVSASLNLKNKDLTMNLSEKDGLVSHYDNRNSHIPEELTAFIERFNGNKKGWKAEIGGDFVKVGRQSYCFPDVTLTSKSGEKRHIELFHKWHSGQLCNRLIALDKNPLTELVLGVCKTLHKDEKISNLLEESKWFKSQGFLFSSFPTTKAVLSLIT